MSLEKYYLKLPDFIKFNPKILKLSYGLTSKIKGFGGVSSQDYILKLMSEGCELKFSGTHRKFHDAYVELLIFIDNVCNKYDIDYWLGYGTLLGAVRHGGFIPWDDDIDLAILRKDYNKLIEVLPEELAEYDLKEHCGLTLLLENKKNYFKGFHSVYDVQDKEGNYMIDGKYNFLQIAWLKPFVKIDVFPFDFIVDEKVANIQNKFPSAQYKFYNDMLDNKITFDQLDAVRREVGFTDSVTEKFSNSIEGVPQWNVEILEYDKTFPLGSIEFEGHKFKCPKDYDHHLTVTFGSHYMEFPKVIENHSVLELIEGQFKSQEEMDNGFDDAINILRKINNSFEKCY